MMDSVLASHGASNDAVVKGLYDAAMQELKLASLLGPAKDAEPFFNLTIMLPIPDGMNNKGE
jgi:hypothetical protein